MCFFSPLFNFHHPTIENNPRVLNLLEKLPVAFATPPRTLGGKNKAFRRSIQSTPPSEQANKSTLRDESRPASEQDTKVAFSGGGGGGEEGGGGGKL